MKIPHVQAGEKPEEKKKKKKKKMRKNLYRYLEQRYQKEKIKKTIDPSREFVFLFFPLYIYIYSFSVCSYSVFVSSEVY